MSFISLTELLNMNANSIKFKAEKDIEQYETLNKMYKKTKDPKIKNLMKQYENKAKKDIKSFEISKKLAKDNMKEINDMRKKNRKILVT
jgi:hypothetical protein